jgi:hypothetical protein
VGFLEFDNRITTIAFLEVIVFFSGIFAADNEKFLLTLLENLCSDKAILSKDALTSQKAANLFH